MKSANLLREAGFLFCSTEISPTKPAQVIGDEENENTDRCPRWRFASQNMIWKMEHVVHSFSPFRFPFPQSSPSLRSCCTLKMLLIWCVSLNYKWFLTGREKEEGEEGKNTKRYNHASGHCSTIDFSHWLRGVKKKGTIRRWDTDIQMEEREL